jgi:hypothetical protein
MEIFAFDSDYFLFTKNGLKVPNDPTSQQETAS